MWTPELQRALETLRAKSADNSHLVHPEALLPHTINTDASGRKAGVVLMQTNEEGETFIVSSTSRVLNSTEQQYSVAEQGF